jgi:putative ABC transport system permease protein
MSRRREFALLRLAGSQRSQVVRALLIETLVIATIAVVCGAVIAAVTMVGYGYLLTDTIWLPFAGSTFSIIAGCAYLAALLGGLAPTHAAMKAGPLEAVS